MKTIIATFLISLLVVGCSYKPGMQRLLNDWAGKPETKLIETWGMPDKVTESPTVKTFEYADCAPEGAFTYPRPKVPNCSEEKRHTWSFDLRDGQVIAARYDEMGADEALVEK